MYPQAVLAFLTDCFMSGLGTQADTALLRTANQLVFIDVKFGNKTVENMQFVLVSNRNGVFNVFFC
jgi:hypothetical protein